MEPVTRQKSRLEATVANVSERSIARSLGPSMDTSIARLEPFDLPNPAPESRVGLYRASDSRRTVLADVDFIESCRAAGAATPSFLEAGPRRRLHFDPASVRAAIVTSGGIAPGLNRVIHAIVQRHHTVYPVDESKGGGIFGVYDGLYGLMQAPIDMAALRVHDTEPWLDRGGSMLGSRRHYAEDLKALAAVVKENLIREKIDVLYLIGGDGSLKAGNALAAMIPGLAVVGVPKTMDNDILWVSQSFGFGTAVESAADILTTLHTEAISTRRVGIVELFGAESGFVTANAALACGRAALVLIPEMFSAFDTSEKIEAAFMECLEHVRQRVRLQDRPGTLVVVAEGVGELLEQRKVTLNGQPVTGDGFAYRIEELLAGNLFDARRRKVGLFVNRPRHHIRSVRPNSFDQTYCERLGALAVETALAGYTGCMVSFWLNEYVLVPLRLVAAGHKRMTTNGMFWKQVCLSTGQPPIEE